MCPNVKIPAEIQTSWYHTSGVASTHWIHIPPISCLVLTAVGCVVLKSNCRVVAGKAVALLFWSPPCSWYFVAQKKSRQLLRYSGFLKKFNFLFFFEKNRFLWLWICKILAQNKATEYVFTSDLIFVDTASLLYTEVHVYILRFSSDSCYFSKCKPRCSHDQTLATSFQGLPFSSGCWRERGRKGEREGEIETETMCCQPPFKEYSSV